MFGQLGLLQFSNMKEPVKLDRDQAFSFADHQILRRKTKIQYTGEEPKTYSVVINLHALFCNIDAELAKMEACTQLTTAGISYLEAMPFFLGNGKFLGNYVIINNKLLSQKHMPNGEYLAVTVELTLKEYVLNEAVNGILDIIA